MRDFAFDYSYAERWIAHIERAWSAEWPLCFWAAGDLHYVFARHADFQAACAALIREHDVHHAELSLCFARSLHSDSSLGHIT